MPIRVLELKDSRNLRIDGTTLRWAVVGSNDENAVLAAVVAAAPNTLGSWIRKPGPKLDNQGHKLFFAEYDYGPVSIDDRTPVPGQGGVSPPPPPPPAPASTDQVTDEFSFNISGQSRRIYFSEETRSRTKRALFVGDTDPAPDFRKAIGVNKKNVEGADRLEPKTEFSITKQFEFVTFAYIDSLAELVGTLNQNDFDPFGKAEELLLLGVTGRGGGQGADKAKPSLTFSFAKSKNRNNVVVSKDAAGVAEITVPTVKGWDYLWCYYLDEPGTTSIFTQRALAAYVERIYPLKDYANLKLYA